MSLSGKGVVAPGVFLVGLQRRFCVKCRRDREDRFGVWSIEGTKCPRVKVEIKDLDLSNHLSRLWG